MFSRESRRRTRRNISYGAYGETPFDLEDEVGFVVNLAVLETLKHFSMYMSQYPNLRFGGIDITLEDPEQTIVDEQEAFGVTIPLPDLLGFTISGGTALEAIREIGNDAVAPLAEYVDWETPEFIDQEYDAEWLATVERGGLDSAQKWELKKAYHKVGFWADTLEWFHGAVLRSYQPHAYLLKERVMAYGVTEEWYKNLSTRLGEIARWANSQEEFYSEY